MMIIKFQPELYERLTNRSFSQYMASNANEPDFWAHAYVHLINLMIEQNARMNYSLYGNRGFRPEEDLCRYEPGGEEERVIATSGEESLTYANAIRRRFELGEPEISRSADTSCYYAIMVLKGEFPAGEKAISRSAYASVEYAISAIGKPFPAGEKTISRNPLSSLRYTQYVLKNRFILGEPAIYLVGSMVDENGDKVDLVEEYERILFNNDRISRDFLSRKDYLEGIKRSLANQEVSNLVALFLLS